jgi:hypothetical protein
MDGNGAIAYCCSLCSSVITDFRIKSYSEPKKISSQAKKHDQRANLGIFCRQPGAGTSPWGAQPNKHIHGCQSEGSTLIEFFRFGYSRTMLAFMMAVVAISLPETVILRKVLKPRLILIFRGLVVVGCIIVGYLFIALI